MNVAAKTSTAVALPPEPRSYPGINWEGLKTLYLKEVRRFWKVGTQTVAAPVVTTLLYMMIFAVALQGAPTPQAHGHVLSTAAFVGPGLIMMAILNNAFANSSSSLIQAKIMGTAPDFLTPPLSPIELLAGFGLGAATRGILVGFVTALAVWPFSHYGLDQLWAILYFGAGASLILGCVGVLTGLWSEKFDQLAAVTNFVIMPMTFLSGTFYHIDRLPAWAHDLSLVNPFFYLIDGFRYGFTGHHDGSLAIGAIYTASLVLIMGFACWEAFRRGWRLKT